VTAAGSSYKGFRFAPEIIRHCVWLYHRFPLSFRDVQELMLERGVEVSSETIRAWCDRFGPEYANQLRRRSRPVLVQSPSAPTLTWWRRGTTPARQSAEAIVLRRDSCWLRHQ
jgi:hypothetical protein